MVYVIGAYIESFVYGTKKLNVMVKSRLTRSRNKMIAGVCAGIAEWLGWDPTIVRILYILISIASVGFPGLLVYIVLWIIMPDEGAYY
jgi:phage shock protein C